MKNFHWDQNCHLGQFAEIEQSPEAVTLIRDRLGINKLFYHLNKNAGQLTLGNYFYEVAKSTGDANQVRSLPSGHRLKIDRSTLETHLECYLDLSKTPPSSDFDLKAFQKTVHQKLTQAFQKIAEEFSDSNFVVCLSGGLDSSIIAHYAKQHLPRVTAASFSFPDLSEDFHSAKSIAETLGIDFLPIIAERTFNPETLDDILIYGQDWRDFNAHCAWVNDIIGRELRKKLDPTRTILLTGDLMNEYVADYAPVEYDGRTYYTLPKINRPRLRKFFVYGLDAGDREIGIFHHHGFTAIQPYSFVVEDYLTVPNEVIEKENCKEVLNLPLLPNERIHQFIQKKKLRAQVGGKGGGTLGLFHEHNITQDTIYDRWQRLIKPYCKEDEVTPIIAAGRYRS